MILRTRGADGSCGCAHNRAWLAIPGAIAVGTRSPINCIFQYTGHGPIVFRRNKQNSIRVTYPFFQLSDFGRRILLFVLVKRRKPSSSNVSTAAPFGASSVAARSAARLYDPCRRLPAIPRIRIGVFICDPASHFLIGVVSSFSSVSTTNTARSLAGSVLLAFSLTLCRSPGISEKLCPV